MGLEKAIIAGKEHRKPYRGAKAFDHSCRNHGHNGHAPSHECPWCLSNRMHNTRVREMRVQYTPHEKSIIRHYRAGSPDWWIDELPDD